MSQKEPEHQKDLKDYLAILRRRLWIVILSVILLPAVSLAIASRQTSIYSATAEVLINPQNLSYALNGLPNTAASDSDLQIKTAAQIARVPLLAQRVLRSVGLREADPNVFLRDSSATPEPTTFILDLSVRNHSPALARTLASAYARGFTQYKQQLDTQSLQTALAAVQKQLAVPQAASAAAYEADRQNRDKLQTMIALQAANTTPIRLAGNAVRVEPKPAQDALFAGAAGLLLGLVLAFGIDALDSRVRTPAEIGDWLRLPLLGRLPTPSRKVRKAKGVVMLSAPYGPEAEAIRVVRANLEFVLVDSNARTIMVTSATPREGKSTSLSNLAVAMARRGKRVVLVDADLRQPTIGALFRVGEHAGLTDVALGFRSLEQALIEVPEAITNPRRSANPADRTTPPGSLHLLTTGALPPDPGELVASEQTRSVIDTLSKDFDLVFVDAPPMLEVGDAASLTLLVDAAIVVVRDDLGEPKMLRELREVLARAPLQKLGFIITGGSSDRDGYLAYSKRARQPFS